jgi:DNA-directed RNA polymerase subunit RPC12/RpoP
MTAQYFLCSECHKKYPTHQKLFETLYEFQRSSPVDCPSCGGKRELRLALDFQLGAGDSEFKVVSAFLPEKLESWLGEEEEEVTFYPFLVVLERGDGSRFCWLPYWHVTGKEARYGQHAICLDQGQFDNLMEQAKKAQERELAPV